MEKEFWKDIKGFEGSFEVSTLGNVRSYTRALNIKRSDSEVIHTRSLEGKVLTPRLTESGYYEVYLHIGNTNVHKKVHRLVAEAFIENPEELKYVFHKDNDRSNNKLVNLFRTSTLKREDKPKRKSPTKITEDIKQSVLSLIKDGVSLRGISKEVGISANAVKKIKEDNVNVENTQ